MAMAANKAYSLNGIALFFGHRNGLGTRRQRHVVFGVLAKQAQESIRVGSNELGQLRVTGTKLLQDGFEHLRLLLHDLAQLLELGVAAKEIEVAEISGASTSTGSGTSSTATALSGKVEQVDVVGAALSLALRGRSSLRGSSRLGRLLALLLDVVRDALHVIVSMFTASSKLPSNLR